MPLMRCPDCHKEISESAISCPNCGLPRPQYELMNRERRQAEDEAVAVLQVRIRNSYLIAAGLLCISVVLLALILLGGWSREALPFKGKLFLWAAVAGGGAYGVFQYAKRLKDGI